MYISISRFTSCLCKKNTSKLNDIAQHLKLLFDPSLNYHPQYEEYTRGTEVKQADVILLGYPLQYDMSKETKLNDLNFYANVTRESGPAMTWAMFAINYLDLNHTEKACEMFMKSYQPYVREPFQVS